MVYIIIYIYIYIYIYSVFVDAIGTKIALLISMFRAKGSIIIFKVLSVLPTVCYTDVFRSVKGRR